MYIRKSFIIAHLQEEMRPAEQSNEHATYERENMIKGRTSGGRTNGENTQEHPRRCSVEGEARWQDWAAWAVGWQGREEGGGRGGREVEVVGWQGREEGGVAGEEGRKGGREVEVAG